MKTFTLITSLCLIALNCFAEGPSISITSRTSEQSPKIIIRSAYDFEKSISLKVRPDPSLLPSDVLIKTISKMGMTDARGVHITSGFDVDIKNDLVLAYSGGTSQIIKASSASSGVNIVASFRDNKGNFISPPKGALALYTTYGEKLSFEYKDIQTTPANMVFILLLDRSGSMVDVIGDVRNSAKTFLKELPPSAECALASFNDSYSYHNKYFQNCNHGDFGLKEDLKAKGGTDLYSPLLDAYKRLSEDDFRDYQKCVIVITDGQIPPDENTKQKLLGTKKDILTFVYFLGEKYEHPLIGLADAFLQETGDLQTNLDHYFHSLSTAYGAQKVLCIRRSNGG